MVHDRAGEIAVGRGAVAASTALGADLAEPTHVHDPDPFDALERLDRLLDDLREVLEQGEPDLQLDLLVVERIARLVDGAPALGIDDALDRVLNNAAGERFHNHSPLDFVKLKGDPDHIERHLVSYIKGFSANARRIFDFFEFESEIERMREANILYLVVSKFCDVELHPRNVPNEQMGLIFENLIRHFNELANKIAGDHFTPREVIRLMVNILFINDNELLAIPGTVRKLLDPACGTGGMLAEAQNYLREHHSAARLYVYGQDYNKRAFATAACAAFRAISRTPIAEGIAQASITRACQFGAAQAHGKHVDNVYVVV